MNALQSGHAVLAAIGSGRKVTFKPSHLFCAAVLASATLPASAAEFSEPTYYGFISGGVLGIEHQDTEVEAFEVELGVKGKVTLPQLNILYQLEADLANALNRDDEGGPGGEDELHIKQAKLIFPTRYGAFILGPRANSGQWADLYSPINHYEYNEPHAALNADGIFGQPDRASGLFAWGSPKFFNIRWVVSTLTLKQDNDTDADVVSTRLVYDDGNWHLGAGIVRTDQAQLPPFVSTDYKRSAVSFGYRSDRWELGAVWEHNQDSPWIADVDGVADYDAYGVSTQLQLPAGFEIALGYKEKNHDYELADESVVTLKLAKHLDQQVKLWAEAGEYENAESNYSLGISLSF